MPQRVTDIFLTDVYWLKKDEAATKWVPVTAYLNQFSPGSGIILKSATNGYAVGTGDMPFNVGDDCKIAIPWNQFNIDGESKDDYYTIFGENEGQIPLTVKSPLIRYRIVTRVDTVPPTDTISSRYSFMMLSADFAQDPFADAGGTVSVDGENVVCNVAFYFPGFNGEDVDTDTASQLITYLQDSSRYEIYNKLVGGIPVKATPSSVQVSNPAGNAAEYGLRRMLITLTVPLSFPQSGTYTITVKFVPNTVAPIFPIPASQTITAVVTEYLGTTQVVLVYGGEVANLIVQVSESH